MDTPLAGKPRVDDGGGCMTEEQLREIEARAAQVKGSGGPASANAIYLVRMFQSW